MRLLDEYWSLLGRMTQDHCSCRFEFTSKTIRKRLLLDCLCCVVVIVVDVAVYGVGSVFVAVVFTVGGNDDIVPTVVVFAVVDVVAVVVFAIVVIVLVLVAVIIVLVAVVVIDVFVVVAVAKNERWYSGRCYYCYCCHR